MRDRRSCYRLSAFAAGRPSFTKRLEGAVLFGGVMITNRVSALVKTSEPKGATFEDCRVRGLFQRRSSERIRPNRPHRHCHVGGQCHHHRYGGGRPAAGTPQKPIFWGLLGRRFSASSSPIVVQLLSDHWDQGRGRLAPALGTSWRMWQEIRAGGTVEEMEREAEENAKKGPSAQWDRDDQYHHRADATMSVRQCTGEPAGAARDHLEMLIFGLVPRPIVPMGIDQTSSRKTAGAAQLARLSRLRLSPISRSR